MRGSDGNCFEYYYSGWSPVRRIQGQEQTKKKKKWFRIIIPVAAPYKPNTLYNNYNNFVSPRVKNIIILLNTFL